MNNLAGFGKAYDKALILFIEREDHNTADLYKQNKTAKAYTNESFLYD
ncbi:MAG: hypothetical protein MJZ26_09005 [Fibrobacter sp.]|nr:hypothetical protein [Fibrobacter sp.]